MKKDPSTIPFDVASSDPGIVAFQTIYSPNGILIEVGKNFADDKIIPIALKIDKLDSVGSNIKTGEWKKLNEWPVRNPRRSRRNIRRKQARLRTKIGNMVNDLHWRTINILTENFKEIIVSRFEVKNMVERKGRNINNKAVRKMLGLSHGAFKKKLLIRGGQRGNHVTVTDESYTSKTCGRCGDENEVAGRIFKCKKCKLVAGRDTIGARNIMIRTFTKEKKGKE